MKTMGLRNSPETSYFGDLGFRLMFGFLVLFALKIVVVDSSYFASSVEEKALVDLLQTRLTKHSPPEGMVNKTVFVFMSLYQIIDVDERNGILTVKLWMYVYYRFKEPLWDPFLYSNVTRMQFMPNTFWKPDVVPLDAIEVKYESYEYQAVWSEGLLAAWSSMVTMKLSCSFNVTYFPYDKHYCPVLFGQWVFNKDHYVINNDVDFDQTDEVDLAFYKPHDQWKLITPLLFTNANRSFADFNFDDKVLHIQIQRDPKFYTFIFVVPVAMLYILSPLVFLLPVDSGEKISMSITLLLAQIVSMGGIANVLPSSSTNFPIISYFLCLTVFQMGAQTLLTVIVINVHQLSGCHKVPQWLRRILSSKVLYLFCMTPCPRMRTQPLAKENDEGRFGKWFMKSNRPKETGKVSPISTKYPMGKTEQLPGDTKLKTTGESSKFRDVVEHAAKVESMENMQNIWKYVAVLLDRFLFLVNILIILTALIAFNISTVNND